MELKFQATGHVNIEAAAEDGENASPAFEADIYHGGELGLAAYPRPVVVDLATLRESPLLVANYQHDETNPVGNFEVANDGRTLRASGKATAATEGQRIVVESARRGYQWQASIEVAADRLDRIDKGSSVEVNGQSFNGPIFVARGGKLVGFGFVSRGADDQTSAQIAARAAYSKGEIMDKDLREFIEAHLPGVDIEALSAEAVANLKADFDGKAGARQKPPAEPDTEPEDFFAAKKAEQTRRQTIMAMAGEQCDKQPWAIDGIKAMADRAIAESWDPQQFDYKLLKASMSHGLTGSSAGEPGGQVPNRVIEAAICRAGMLKNVEKHFDEQTLEAADKHYKGISLSEVFAIAAERNGYRGHRGNKITLELQRAAFGMLGPGNVPQISANFSSFSLPETLANTSNKFLRTGWNRVEQSALDIAGRRPTSDFKETTTISLHGGNVFEEVNAAGELKHGRVAELPYKNQVDTYGKIFSITRQDLINDDLGALTQVPNRLGRGGMLKLNLLFWAEFLDDATFFSAGNNNLITPVLSDTGLEEAEKTFRLQTDPDGNPLGSEPEILLVPPSLAAQARRLVETQGSRMITGETSTRVDSNIWIGQFRVVVSSYLENGQVSGGSATAWYLLSDPEDIPVIEIAALGGQIMPTVETADADFNVLGVQMRGYNDIGARKQEFRGGVKSSGTV